MEAQGLKERRRQQRERGAGTNGTGFQKNVFVRFDGHELKKKKNNEEEEDENEAAAVGKIRHEKVVEVAEREQCISKLKQNFGIETLP